MPRTAPTSRTRRAVTPPTDYYLVTTTNPDGLYAESDRTNNSAWAKFTLSTDSNGNRKITVTSHSPCDSPGMCGEVSANR